MKDFNFLVIEGKVKVEPVICENGFIFILDNSDIEIPVICEAELGTLAKKNLSFGSKAMVSGRLIKGNSLLAKDINFLSIEKRTINKSK